MTYMTELNAKDFWDRVEAACAERKITQIVLCEKAGLTLQSLRTAVSRSYMPKFDTVILIAEVLDYPLDYFATGKLPALRPVTDILNEVRQKIDDIEAAQDKPIALPIKRKA